MDIRNSDRLFNYLETLHLKYNQISERLSQPEIINNQTEFRELSKEISRLRPLEKKYVELSKMTQQKKEAEELKEKSDDADLTILAKEEIEDLGKKINTLIDDIKINLVSDESTDNRSAFLEIRAGAGGNEASLFAGDLLRMYLRLAERKNWKAEVMSTTYSAIGGIKEIIIYIKGIQVYKHLRHESGVHRVQRIPITESGGRIHTSTVTVAVLPEVDDVEVKIDTNDIRIDAYAASGPGGQHVNKTQSAIRITHFPSGIIVTCQDEKSQHRNKEKALKVLQARLYEHEKTKQDDSIASKRKSQVGSGERSEKIRTYNYPQNRVTDHRISGRNFTIEPIMDGNLVELISLLIDQYVKSRIEEKLTAFIR